MRPRPIVPTAILLAAMACNDGGPPTEPEAPTPGPVILIEHATYSWTRDEVVRFAVTNPDGVPLWLDCPFWRLQVYINGWRDLPNRISCDGFAIERARVDSGAALIGSFPLSNDYIPRQGAYRLRFAFFKDADRRVAWSLASRTSRAFQVGP